VHLRWECWVVTAPLYLWTKCRLKLFLIASCVDCGFFTKHYQCSNLSSSARNISSHQQSKVGCSLYTILLTLLLPDRITDQIKMLRFYLHPNKTRNSFPFLPFAPLCWVFQSSKSHTENPQTSKNSFCPSSTSASSLDKAK
jgi:hypothetical protein